jgi:ABC-type Fe3+/spermidine/putrescine transport system ATPase subunit
VTHDQEEALVMSDRVGVMNCGMLEQVGPAADVFERPATEFVARFMGADNFFEQGGRRFAVRPEKLRLQPAGDRPPSQRAVPVQVVERIYQGLGTVCIAKTADGTKYSVYMQNSGGTAGLNADVLGAVLTWDAEHEIPLTAGRV